MLLVLLAVGLAVYALVDLASSDERRRGGIPKWLWVVLIVLLPYLGPVAWILVGRAASRGPGGTGVGRAGGPAGTGPARRRRGPVAPDDDPDFLWRLEQQRRRQDRETDPAPGTDVPPTSGPSARPGEGTDGAPPSDVDSQADAGPDDSGPGDSDPSDSGSGPTAGRDEPGKR